MTNSTMNPRAKSIGVLNTGRPVHTVAIQAATAIALGIAMAKADAAEHAHGASIDMPVANM